jgi:hypothetical protein
MIECSLHFLAEWNVCAENGLTRKIGESQYWVADGMLGGHAVAA